MLWVYQYECGSFMVASTIMVGITIWGGEYVKNVGYGGLLELAKKDTISINDNLYLCIKVAKSEAVHERV